MANLNRVTLIGRLTRDPEVRSFSNGGKVAKFGFAVNNRKRNATSGQWEDEPVWLNCEAFNRGDNGTMADRVERMCRKGSQVYLECHLVLDQWTTQQGEKRSQLKLVVDQLQMLDGRGEGGQEGGGYSGQESGGFSSRQSGQSGSRGRMDGPRANSPAYDDEMPPPLSESRPQGDFGPESDLPF